MCICMWWIYDMILQASSSSILEGSGLSYEYWLVPHELLLHSHAKSKLQSSSGAAAVKLEKVAPDYRNSLGHC